MSSWDSLRCSPYFLLPRLPGSPFGGANPFAAMVQQMGQQRQQQQQQQQQPRIDLSALMAAMGGAQQPSGAAPTAGEASASD